MPDDPANLWNRWAVHLLPCITMQCGILALPFHTSTPGWEQLPVTLAMLIKGDHQTIRHQLHKAEEHRIAGFEFIPQQCRSYRWSAESLPATDEQSILIHAYWGMGLHAPHPAVYGLCIRFHDSCAESKELPGWLVRQHNEAGAMYKVGAIYVAGAMWPSHPPSDTSNIMLPMVALASSCCKQLSSHAETEA